jgi:hypothetical protein
MHHYQISPHIYLESFEEDAVLLVADHDYMITVNHAGAQLFKQAQEVVGNGLFSRSDCVNFLLDHYELTAHEAVKKMRSIIGFGLMQYVIVKQ